MNLYTIEEADLDISAALHEDDDENAVRTAEYLDARGLKLDENANVVENTTSEMVALVCSCGSMMCGMIERYGHPRPVYGEAIEPLPTQSARDRHAVELKGGAW